MCRNDEAVQARYSVILRILCLDHQLWLVDIIWKQIYDTIKCLPILKHKVCQKSKNLRPKNVVMQQQQQQNRIIDRYHFFINETIVFHE